MSEVEVITACENVCRDFSWINQLILKLEPAAPIIAAIIAAIGAYLIAVKAYARQKDLDRKSRLVEDKQKVYQAYLKTLADEVGIMSENENKEKLREIRFEIVRHRMELLCVGSDSVIRLVNAVSDARGKLDDAEGIANYWNLIASLAHCMRRDCFPGTQATIDDFRQALPFSFRE